MSRLSVRSWSKGSARGAGPAQVSGTVRIHGGRVEQCGLCGRRTFAPGLGHGARLAIGAAADWPWCAHGERYLEGCLGDPVPPSCCVPAGWGVLLLMVVVLGARRATA